MSDQKQTVTKRILLVGGGGYIGSVLTGHLLEQGYHVRCFDSLIYGDNSGVLPHLNHDKYEFVFGDLTDKAMMGTALREVSDVVLLGGLVGDPICKKYPEVAERTNYNGLIQLVNTLNGKGLNHVIFTSTCSNYGLLIGEQIADENFPLNPLSSYAKAKVAVEKAFLSMKGKVDYTPTILRFATAFGLSPRMRFDLTLNEFTKDLFRGKKLLVYDAQTWRPYCHVRDLSRAIQVILKSNPASCAFEVFNVGGMENNATKETIVQMIQKAIPNQTVQFQDEGPDPRNYRVNFSKIREVFSFCPSVTLQEGIDELLSAFKKHLFDQVNEKGESFGNYQLFYELPIRVAGVMETVGK